MVLYGIMIINWENNILLIVWGLFLVSNTDDDDDDDDDDNNNIYLLQLGCHPVAVVIFHVYKILNLLLINLN